MEFDLDMRKARLGVGEFSDFVIGPKESAGLGGGLWRAQLGTRWHQEMRRHSEALNENAEFEVAIKGELFHGGWILSLHGRIDQMLRSPQGVLLREIKTVSHSLPMPEEELRGNYPAYFVQLAAYLEILAIEAGSSRGLSGELVFVEAGSGVCQTLRVEEWVRGLLQEQLGRVTEFLNHRLAARERLRNLRFSPAFGVLREGQESARDDLLKATEGGKRIVFSAPTGFGKTGILLETALEKLKSGVVSRVIYLTSKATGQMQVAETLERMGRGEDGLAVASWQVRPKVEHCINTEFRCTREHCRFIRDVEERWKHSGLSGHYLFSGMPNDIDSLKRSGEQAAICPYEITRAALAWRDVWIGDFNYVFSPDSSKLFSEQPGFDPTETLLIIDEAHNLPSRAADAYSHAFRMTDALTVLDELGRVEMPTKFLRTWEVFSRVLGELRKCPILPLDVEDDLLMAVRDVSEQLVLGLPSMSDLSSATVELIWSVPGLLEWLNDERFPKLLWSPKDGELQATCLDAAAITGEILRGYKEVLLSSATTGPLNVFAEKCGLDENEMAEVEARTPWRDRAYRVCCDLRVDTRFQHRARYYGVTVDTIARLQETARSAVVVFVPSYAYGDILGKGLEEKHPFLRVAMQPRLRGLGEQNEWVEESLAFSDVLILVLGSSFAEGIDSLGSRVSHAMVVGPALPEVNPVQEAKFDELYRRLRSREQAFERVFQVPGIQKVNQALGRLVRAPGQKATVILHCKRFAEISYARLLNKDYQMGDLIENDAELDAWLRADEGSA